MPEASEESTLLRDALIFTAGALSVVVAYLSAHYLTLWVLRRIPEGSGR